MYKHLVNKNKLFKDFSIVLVSYKSNKQVTKLISKFNKKISVIVVENSKDVVFRDFLQQKYKNVEVVVTKKNKGFSDALNIGIKKSTKKYVLYLDNDIVINDKQILKIVAKGQSIKKFGAITAKIHKQEYKDLILSKPKIQGLKSVSYNTGCVMLLERKTLKRMNYFDNNIFLYFEESDYYKRCQNNNYPILLFEGITIKHEGASSLDKKYLKEYNKVRCWHYCWSKFYYYKKHYGYLTGLSKTFPNLVRSIKNIFFSILKFDINTAHLSYIEIEGLICSYFSIKPFYRIIKK